jgi:hypothetical protein
MFFDNTTDRRARHAIELAHAERGKILGEVWGLHDRAPPLSLALGGKRGFPIAHGWVSFRDLCIGAEGADEKG